MDRDKIEEIVIGCINDQIPKYKKILTSKEAKKKGYLGEEDTRFQSDLGFDSLKTVELFLECEKIFGITFTDDEIFKADTINKLINKIQEKQQKNG